MPVDFTGITTTRGREYETPYLMKINEGLKDIPIDQRAAILGSIIEESGGNPFAVSDSRAYQGLLQWGADRYRPQSRDPNIELNNQVQYILNTVNNSTDSKSWTHGGKGSGYNSKDETYSAFHDDNTPFDKKFRAFSYGYVRPKGKEDSYNNRLKVGKKVLNKLVVNEVLSRPQPDKIPRYDFESYMFKPKKRFDEGGYLDENSWDNLSMKDKAEMMRVAIANGITTLPEIRQAYNEFAKGGRMNNWTMQDEAGYRYWRSRLPKNLKDTNDNDYDMRAAYKAGMQPMWNNEDKSYHLGSRDPKSGRILKTPHHPTFLKALATDASLGYYPTLDSNGNVYTETWQGNQYAQGGYKPSESIKRRITNWEGASMKTNRSFAAEANDFNRVIPAEIRSKLSPQQLDALYSYGYNVGMGKLKERVLPTLTAYTQGRASREDVQRSMWASKDNQLRGLTTRRNAERELFGGNFRTEFTGKGGLGSHINLQQYLPTQDSYENFNLGLESLNIPQLQMPDMDIDPATMYKPPVIDESLFNAPKPVETPVYNPKQEKLDNLQKFNTIMGLFGQDTPFAGLVGNDNTNDSGIMTAINAVYGNRFDMGGHVNNQEDTDIPIVLDSNQYGFGGLLTNASNGVMSLINDSIDTIKSHFSDDSKPKYTVYRSLSGKTFKTSREAAVDNFNLKNGKGDYAPQDITYDVKSGDNLWNIAKQNNISLDTLYSYNPQYKEGKMLMPNDKIIIGKTLGLKAYNVREQWNKENSINQDNVAAIQSIQHDGNYVIIDKKNKKLDVYSKDNKLIYQTNDISTGTSGNDYNTITYVDDKGKIIDGKGNNSTPAGITQITGTGTYHGFPSFTRGRKKGDSYEDIASSMHYGKTDKVNLSNGCVRVGGNTLNKLAKYIGVGTNVYTLPAKGGSRFVSKDGKLSFVADNPYGTDKGSKRFWDDYNVQTDKSYSKLALESKTKGSEEYKNNERKYMDAITSNKAMLMQKFNIDSDTYNHLAELALGIAQQETQYGTSTRKKIKDATPDVLLNAARGNSNRSRGLTQIKLMGDNKGMQKIYNELGLNEDNLDSADMSAIATLARLAYIYNTEVRGHKYKGENDAVINPYDALLYKWMGSNGELRNHTATPNKNTYIRNVKKYANNYDLYSIRS